MKKIVMSKGKVLDLSKPKIMAIVNLTPDSFFQGSRVSSINALDRMRKYLEDGADILDLGAYSTRPGATEISPQEELDRLGPVLERAVKEWPEVWFSVDTFRASVAKEACSMGARIINDVSGGTLDPDMFSVVADAQVAYVLMHMRGDPNTMVNKANYVQVTEEVIEELNQQIQRAKQAGIRELIIDPGFGFAKTIEQNYTLIGDLDAFHLWGFPILVGVSRKSMIYKALEITPEEALPATAALHMILLQKGSSILRVHDPKEASQVLKMREWIQ